MIPEAARPASRWRRLRRTVQLLVLLLFLYLLLATQVGVETVLPHDLFFRLDPLAGFSAMISARRWMAPLLLGGSVLLLTLVVGWAWCGWLCPMGTVLDWVPSRGYRANGTSGRAGVRENTCCFSPSWGRHLWVA